MANNIAIYGAAFNPPHLGHLDALKQIKEDYQLIYLVPSATHAFNKQMLPMQTRCHMLKLLLKSYNIPFYFGKPNQPQPQNQTYHTNNCTTIYIDPIENELANSAPDKPVYTWDLLQHYRQQHDKNSQITFVIGPDNAIPQNWQRFYRYQDIEKEFTIQPVQENLAIRSSTIRALCSSQIPTEAKLPQLELSLGKELTSFILEQNFYANATANNTNN